MRISRRAATTSIAASFLVVGTAIPVLAATSYPDGGQWNYGENSSIVWSDYYHAANCHGSSVQGKTFVSSSKPAAQWSTARAQCHVA